VAKAILEIINFMGCESLQRGLLSACILKFKKNYFGVFLGE